MINLAQTNLLSLSKEDLLNITKQEIQEYVQVREYNSLTSNIPRVKNLEALDRRLQVYSIEDGQALELRNEIHKLLNNDVYINKKIKKNSGSLSNYEVYQKYLDNFR